MRREAADKDDFEFARDRLMMGIERKSLSVDERVRLHTAIHEAGHSIVCYFTKNAKNLYKTTIVARGDSLGAVSGLRSEWIHSNWLLYVLIVDVHGLN